MSGIKLLPCPHCGCDRLEPAHLAETGKHFIRCLACACEGPWGKSAAGAATWWNLRSPAGPAVARPLKEWSEDDGEALWWRFPVAEAPYVGSPLASDWPGCHTYWTPLPPVPAEPGAEPAPPEVAAVVQAVSPIGPNAARIAFEAIKGIASLPCQCKFLGHICGGCAASAALGDMEFADLVGEPATRRCPWVFPDGRPCAGPQGHDGDCRPEVVR